MNYLIITSMIFVFYMPFAIANIELENVHMLEVGVQHSGGTDRNGCHHDRKRGGYHCH